MAIRNGETIYLNMPEVSENNMKANKIVERVTLVTHSKDKENTNDQN